MCIHLALFLLEAFQDFLYLKEPGLFHLSLSSSPSFTSRSYAALLVIYSSYGHFHFISFFVPCLTLLTRGSNSMRLIEPSTLLVFTTPLRYQLSCLLDFRGTLLDPVADIFIIIIIVVVVKS